MVNFQFVMLVFQKVVTDIEYPRFAGALFPKPNSQRWVISAQQKTCRFQGPQSYDPLLNWNQ